MTAPGTVGPTRDAGTSADLDGYAVPGPGSRVRTAPVRRIELARAAWGLGLVAAPSAVLRLVPGATPDPAALTVARVLGARQVAQAVLSGVRTAPQALALGVWVDLAHAATGVGLAVTDRRRAGLGVADGLVALGWATLGWRDLGRDDATGAGGSRRDRFAGLLLRRLPGGRSLRARVRGRPGRSHPPA